MSQQDDGTQELQRLIDAVQDLATGHPLRDLDVQQFNQAFVYQHAPAVNEAWVRYRDARAALQTVLEQTIEQAQATLDRIASERSD